MSYIFLEDGIPGFQQAVISFWFRVPKEIIDRAADETVPTPAPPMAHIIPMLIFGKKFQGYKLEEGNKGVGTYTLSYLDGWTNTITSTEAYEYNTGQVFTKGEVTDQDPSYIGIYCNRPEGEDTIAVLQIRLQTESFGKGSWVFKTDDRSISDHTAYASYGPNPGIASAYSSADGECSNREDAGNPRLETTTPVDQSDIWCAQWGPDSFQIGGSLYGEGRLKIEPDTWHHLLLSFDLAHSTKGQGATYFAKYTCSPTPEMRENVQQSINDPCKAWLALDNENRRGEAIADARLGDGRREEINGFGLNDIAPYNVYAAAFSGSSGISSNVWWGIGLRRVQEFPTGGMPTYSYEPMDLPTNQAEFGLPGTRTLVDRICHIELAEFQLFTERTLDTQDETNRKAFIDFPRNPDGTPGTPVGEGDSLGMIPVNPEKAKELLGKRPEVLLHTSADWKIGKNTGSLGTNEEGETILSGQFVPTGTIKKFPGPRLGT